MTLAYVFFGVCILLFLLLLMMRETANPKLPPKDKNASKDISSGESNKSDVTNNKSSVINTIILGAASERMLRKREERYQERKREREQRDRDLWQWQEKYRK